MDLDLIVAVVEIIGGIGVIVSLIYLAIQVRENTKLQKIESRRYESQSTDPFMSQIVGDPEVAKMFLAGIKDSDSLAEEEYLRFSLLFGQFMAANTMVFEEHEAGLASQDDLDRRTKTISMFLDTPGGRQFWLAYSHNYPPKFQRFIEANVLEK